MTMSACNYTMTMTAIMIMNMNTTINQRKRQSNESTRVRLLKTAREIERGGDRERKGEGDTTYGQARQTLDMHLCQVERGGGGYSAILTDSLNVMGEISKNRSLIHK